MEAYYFHPIAQERHEINFYDTGMLTRFQNAMYIDQRLKGKGTQHIYTGTCDQFFTKFVCYFSSKNHPMRGPPTEDL